MKKLIISIGLASLCAGLWGVRQVRAADNGLEPKFKQSSYVNESVTLKNRYVTLHFFKRIKGWGWAEIETPSGKLMAVMDHLGELMIRDQDIRCASRPTRCPVSALPKARVWCFGSSRSSCATC